VLDLEPPNPICGVPDDGEATVRLGARIYGSRFRKLTVEVPAGYPADRARRYIEREARSRVQNDEDLIVRWLHA